MIKRENIKPFSWGAASGIAAAAIVAFGTGWVTTGGSRDSQVRAAWVDAQAEICSSLVTSHRMTADDQSELYGYQARDRRQELAQTFAVALPGQDAAPRDVIRACADMLNQRPS